jgi:predicted ester cyclase
MGIPPTGKQVTLPGVVIDRIADGQLVESWLQADVLGMLQQLGVIQPTAGAAA